jgi:hypothetical protein
LSASRGQSGWRYESETMSNVSPPQTGRRFVAVVKAGCPTCRLIAPVLAELDDAISLQVLTQDDVAAFAGVTQVIEDSRLEFSFHNKIQIVPTLLQFEDDQLVNRTEGWDRQAWRDITGAQALGAALVAHQPGCGSLSVGPGMAERLSLRFGALKLSAREIEVDESVDPVEVIYDRGWSDGLPVVTPTDIRIARMLAGTHRKPDEEVGLIPPNLVTCTIEKAAINAVMAGCRPEYFPVVLGALETMLEPEFSLHGLICTTWFSGPTIIVNGPIAKQIGLNSKGNVFGQGNRANSTIGRAVQLIIRNVGGGRPGEIDRAVFGHPGKVGFCFAEDESDGDWQPLNESRGFAAGTNTVTAFHGDGVHGIRAHRADDARSLTASLAMGLVGVCHPKLYEWSGAILAISPDHYAVYQREGWGREQIEAGIIEALRKPGSELVEGAGGVAEGIAKSRADEWVDKFHPGALLVVRAGGPGSLLSAVIGGWAAMRRPHEVQPVTREIRI